MSLIPSESYSFPDHFTKTVTPSRKPKNQEPEVAPLEARRKKPSIVALPDPKPEPAPVPPVIEENPAPVQSQAPAPAMIRETIEPARSKASAPPTPPAPNPALRRASAPPPRIPEPPKKIALPPSLKPKVRWNNRAPAMDPAPLGNNGAEQIANQPPTAPAQNVIQMKPIQRPRPPRMMPPPESLVRREPLPAPPPPNPAPVSNVPRPPQTPPALVRQAPRPAQAAPVSARQAPRPPQASSVAIPKAPRPVAPRAQVPESPRRVAVSNPQADFFEMFAESGETALARRRRKTKMRRFVVCESIAVAILLPLAILGLAHRPENVALLWIMNISTITSAVAAALIPIFFFAFTPTLPEIER